jgi:hypothetical protein
MRRRRISPYSHIEVLRHSRQEILVLVLLTVGAGVALSLLSDLLGATLADWMPGPGARYALVGVSLLLFVGVVVALFYARSEGRWLQIEIQVPYHLPAGGQPAVVRRGSYGVTVHARRAFVRRYRRGSPALQDWLDAWRRAQGKGMPFQRFAAADNAALVQCLVLYALHRYGQASLGPEAAYGWCRAGLPARQLTMDDLPPGLADNPFLRADQRAGEWRLWWPREVEIELAPDKDGQNPFPRWRLKHRRYGYVDVRWFPHVSVAGQGSQVWQVLTQRLKLDKRSRVFILGTRLETHAHFLLTFWPRGDAFNDWATGLLAYLEEALDWGYYLKTRTDRLVAIQDQRLGWVPRGTSVWEKLQEIEARLGRLEVQETVLGQVKGGGGVESPPDMGEEPPEGEALVV